MIVMGRISRPTENGRRTATEVVTIVTNNCVSKFLRQKFSKASNSDFFVSIQEPGTLNHFMT